MAFQALQDLGQERFDILVNQVMRGTPPLKIARQMLAPEPEGWGVFPGMAENTLEKQLARLRDSIAAGHFNAKRAKSLREGKGRYGPPILQNVSVKVLDRLEELAEEQRDRMFELRAREKESLLPQVSAKMAPQEYRHLLTQTNAVLSDYRETLIQLQDVRFKLGLDELKLPQASLKGASQTLTVLPDGMSFQKQVFEAVSTVERVLNARQIKPHVPTKDYIRHAPLPADSSEGPDWES